MINVWIAVLLIIIIGAGCGFAGYKIGYKKGDEDRENQILQDFVSYIPLGRIGEIAEDLMENDGLSENFPMLVVMPDKYDYLESVELGK